MVGQLGIEGGGIEPDGVDRGLAIQRLVGTVANPARQHGFGVMHAPPDFAGAVIKCHQCTARRENVGLVTPPCPIGTFGRLDFKLRLRGLFGNDCSHCLGVIPVKPG